MVDRTSFDRASERRAAEILDSFRRHFGRDLIERSGDPSADARLLFELPIAVLAHDASPQPLLDWVNRAAAVAFDAAPEDLLGLPSAATTPADAVADRGRLFETLARQGFVTGYAGVRVTRSGRRFTIADVTVLVLADASGRPAGHAAVIGKIGPAAATTSPPEATPFPKRAPPA